MVTLVEHYFVALFQVCAQPCTYDAGSDCRTPVCVLELGQYTNISTYRNTDNCNIISIHPIKVSIYRSIVIYRNISTYFREY